MNEAGDSGRRGGGDKYITCSSLRRDDDDDDDDDEPGVRPEAASFLFGGASLPRRKSERSNSSRSILFK